ncbi:MAG TPA: 16S rRNA (guanine(966)-N(2))-methyltransferase RsmD [Vicinamibacterales bacterium]|nr:16S rRNA (guanine(966)-N(2))-methyltransferase RsmD [Vicinamibacterales bacterium]
MRIIAGEFKGRRLRTPTWNGLRPTSDKLRETLFNILAPRIAGATVLDVFAGTGAVGLESLSRGATRAVFIEQDRRAADLIRANVALCGVENRCAIIRDGAERALQRDRHDEMFDVIVLDPPYEFEPLGEVLEAAVGHLAPGGVLILEHASRRPAPDISGGRRTRTVRSGDSHLTMIERV